MKIVFLILVLATLNSCQGQNKQTTSKKDTIMKNFDIETFNKNKTNNKYSFIKNDTIRVSQRENKQNFIEIFKTKEDFFEEFNAYYKNGNINVSVKRFPNSFLKGILKEYNEVGELVKEEDLDKPYLYTWEDIKKYLMQHKVEDIQKEVLSIRRFNEPEKTEYTRKGSYWELEFKGEYNNIKGQFFIELDGKTGKELLVKKFKGKGALGEDATIAVYDTIYREIEKK